MTQMSVAAPLPVRSDQTVRLILIGAALWFLAAMILRFVGPLGAFDGWNRVLTYVLVIPGTLPFVLLSARLAGLLRNQIARGVAIITATATLLDGVALAWFPGLYGSGVEQAANSAAAILWGAGVGLVLGLAMDRAERA